MQAAPARTFTGMLDLGCGTGLAGVAFRPVALHLSGVDLSPGMIAEARRKAIYDDLVVADMGAYLHTTTRRFDLVVAADVFVYAGALDTLFAAVRRVMDGGVFAFTVQHREGADFVLGTEHRYSHSRAYIAACAAAAGFTVTRLDDGVFRQEKGVDVPGLLALLQPA
jgi:predicted TPR repeat methyltransferase